MNHPSLPRTETVHRVFRGAIETAKLFAFIALCFEGSMAILAAGNTLGWSPIRDGAKWLPLGALILSVLSVCFRAYASHARSYAHRCKKTAARAYASGLEVEMITASNAEGDAPLFAEFMASHLPAQTLDQYYEPKSPIGEDRLREMYAHSAFFSRSQLRIFGIYSAVLALILFAFVFVAIYGLAAVAAVSETDVATRQVVLDTLCSIVLAVLFVRSSETAIATLILASSIRGIEDALFKRPSGEELRVLTDAYDLELAGGRDTPTILYRILRKRLAFRWSIRGQTLFGGSAASS